jgi:apolipoprotein N-acyltransferase
MSPRLRLVLWASAAGAFGATCWLPLGLAPLLPLNFVLAMRGLRRIESGRDAVLFGLANGAARYAVAAHFLLVLTRYSVPLGIAFYLLAIAYILPFAVLEAWGCWRLERHFRLPRVVGFALLWSLLEKVRTLGDVSFPADLVPHAFGTAPAWLAWNDWIGPVGFTLLNFAVALLVDQAIERRGAGIRAFGWALAGVVLWLAPVATDALRSAPAADGPALDVGIVQPAIRAEEKLDRASWPALWQRMERLTARAAEGAELVVWPETSRPGPLVWRGDGPFRDPEMQSLADRHGVPILYGCEIARVQDGRVLWLHNGAALVVPGRPEDGDWYGKQHLLPFVEGVPFADWIGWDPAKRRRDPGRPSPLSLLGNFKPGPRPTVFEVGPARLGVLICFEGLYHALGRRYRQADANALVVMTNDAWWGRSVFAPWHARMISSQARSNGLPVIRAANSGVSSTTSDAGRMGERTDLDATTTLRVRLRPSTGAPSFFVRHGNLVPWGIVVALLGWAGWFGIVRRGA